MGVRVRLGFAGGDAAAAAEIGDSERKAKVGGDAKDAATATRPIINSRSGGGGGGGGSVAKDDSK